MNTFLFASVENLWLLAGWTMIHFLWLGTLAALAAFLCRWLLRRASANVRYATSLACLALLAGLPIAIASWLHQNPPPSEVKDSLQRRSAIEGLASAVAQEPIANLTSEPMVDRAKQEPISTNPAPATPAQITTHAEVVPPSAPTTSPAPLAERDALSLAVFAINTAVHYLPWLWLIGTPITFALTATGLLGARRLRRASHPITDGLIHETLEKLAASLHLSRRVAVAICDRIAAPVLIGILRPIILLPPAALTGYTADEIEMVLLHELAHVRRWDNLVNLIQRLIESLLFFHPAVWLISSWVRRERETCCDALVVTRTDRPHAYAELLVALAAQMPRSVLFHPAASSAMAAGPLQSRIRRILKLDDDPMLVSGKSIAVLLASLLVTATIVGLYLPTDGRAEPSKPESRQNNDLAELPGAEFSHQVKFEKGAAKFLDGDSISIDEVRGTAETFLPGNRYWVKGTYKLKSHDRAQISAFTTAAKAEEGTGPTQSEQTKQVNGGEAAFTLILPMSVRGWPHLSFYPADNGGDFGGVYFGTGDSVLKKWWGEAAGSANESSKPSWSDADRERFHRVEKAIKDVEIVVALFNDKDGFFPALDETHKQLSQHERSLYTYGLKADPASEEAKRFNLTSAPTCIVFRSGKEVARLTPIQSPKQLQEFVTFAVNSGTADVAQLLPLFQLKEDEQSGEKIYRLPAAMEVVFPELPELIERLKKDPSRSQFTYNLKDSGRVMEVFAPDAAHQQFFGQRIAQWGKSSNSDSNAEKQTTDNLNNLGLAIQNYHAARLVLPAHAIYDAKGKPLLSWRVQILPYLDEWKLYQEFHLNEPWDSEHNRKLIARMPNVFKNPKVNKPGMTNYLAVVGKECVFNGSPKGLSINQVMDGTARTIAFVEANADLATEWTKPQDWNFDRAEPTKGLGQLWPGGWYGALVDGSVRRIENSEPADRVGIQFTRAGNESKSLAESASRTATARVEGGPADAIDAALSGGPGPAPGEAADAAPPAAANDGRSLALVGSVDPETELLLREIIDIQKKKSELEGQLYQSQTDYLVKKSELDDPQLGESQKRKLEKQQFEKEHKIRFAALQQQLAITLKSLDERMKVLKGRNEKSVEVQNRDAASARVLPSTKNAQSPSVVKQKLDEDWPAGVVIASPKDAEISKRAWREWRIKVAPETQGEQREAGDDGVKVVSPTLPLDAPSAKSPMILVSLNGIDTRNFDQLATALGAVSEQRVVIAECVRFTSRGGTIRSRIALDGTDKPAIEDESDPNLPPTLGSGAKASAKFPSLEDQKLTDLVWKRLRLEVKPIGPVDLKRVQAFGYDGGLEVVESTADFVKSGDLLVGLHVWPTRNIKDVAEVLKRPDLAELSPLKFYVIRNEQIGTVANKEQTRINGDLVQTGRIAVKLPESGSEYHVRADKPDSSPKMLVSNPADRLSPSKLRIYFFYSPTAEPSVKARTALQQVVKQFSDVKLDECDVSRESEKAKNFAVGQVPTCLIVRDGEIVRRIVGLQDEKELHKEINDALSIRSDSPIATSKALQAAAADKPQSIAAPPLNSTVNARTAKAEPLEKDRKPTAPAITGIVPNTNIVKRSDGSVGPVAIDPNSPGPRGGKSQTTPTPAESVFIAYDIPQDLKERALQYFTRSDVRSMADDRGRYLIQAPQDWHDRFAAMLKATPKWRDPSAAKEHAAAPIGMTKTGDEDFLEWRSVGLSLKRNSDSRNLPLTSARGDQSRVAVAEVVPGSPAAWADIRTDDVLTNVGSFNAGSMPEVRSLLKALGEGLQSKKSVHVNFFRKSDPRYGTISLTADFTLGPEDLGAAPVESQTANPPSGTPSRPAVVDKANISYDGKSFSQWRTLWDQSDVDQERKLRALSALEAFAEAGLQREANGAIMYGLYSDAVPVAQRTRQYLNGLSKTDAAPIVNALQFALKSDLSSDRRVRSLRGLAAIGPNAESALPELEKSLAKKNPRERIAAATAIKKIVGKDKYQKPVADVLGKELGITVQLTGNGVWAALPRADSVDASAFNKFTEDVIKEQDSLFPPPDNKPSK